jgi:Ankyrin repeats (3 copies)/Squalene-hopene cyclase C-terminal domain/Ankyrin repeat
MGAAFGGDLEVVRCLIEHGADVSARTQKGFTALHGAAVSGNAHVIELLLNKGADPNARYELPRRNGDVQTPTMAAAEQGHAQCLKLLLDRGADVNVQGGPFERSALLCAATTGNEKAVRLLIDKGAKVNAEDWEGEPPLAWARKRGETEIVKLLRDAGGQEPAPLEGKKERPRLHKRIDADSVRLSVNAALPPLQRSALKITETQGCITCHQHSLLAMTVGVVRKHGLAVDEEMASQVRSQVQALLSLKIPPLLLAADFDALLAPYTLVGMAAEDEQPNRLTDALVHYLVLRQKTDGRWLAEAYRPPEDGSDFMFTALAVRGLQVYTPKGRRKEIEARISMARDWLKRAKPSETVDRVFHCLGLHWANAGSEAVQEAVSCLLREQREDGGWAQLPTLPSDAYATGQVLYALHEAGGLSALDPVFQRGVEFLLRTQLADGSWYVPTRCFPVLEFSSSGFPHGRSQYSSAAATCWATMALALAVPAPQQPKTVLDPSIFGPRPSAEVRSSKFEVRKFSLHHSPFIPFRS